MVELLFADIYGYLLLQVGAWGQGECGPAHDNLRHRLFATLSGRTGRAVACHAEALPVATGSVDAVFLPHTLEYAISPHAVLREAERVLVSEGHIVILGFNPWSAWSLARLGRRNRFPWNGRPVAEGRLREWCSLLGLEVVKVHRGMYRPPVQAEETLKRTLPMESWAEDGWLWPGAVYGMLARKRLFGMTPLRQQWTRAASPVGGLVGPTR